MTTSATSHRAARGSVLVIAEKPSVARDIAYVLGARTRAEGYLSGAGFIVTWAIGHLVALAEPHEMNPDWKRWRLSDLPLLPQSWPLITYERTRDQFSIVRKLLRSSDVRGVICATDAGREGELIFRYIYEAAGASKPVKRLWISSLTPEAIVAGFRALRMGADFDRLADAARARSRADWLVGMNLSRLYSVQNDANLSVGRVQTPTLAMIVARDLEIRAFVPEDYLEVVATFGPDKTSKDTYRGTYERPQGKEPELRRRLPPDGELANTILARARRGDARIDSVTRHSRSVPPPLLYDLTELQRHANRLYGFTAQRTLAIAQALYEEHKLISYPRTDSRHVSKTVAATFPAIAGAVAPLYPPTSIAEGTGERALSRRFVDDSRVSDHHAILPTATRSSRSLPRDEQRIYDLICRRFLSAWHADHVYAITTIKTHITADGEVDTYVTTGTSVEIEGWKALDVRTTQGKPEEPTLPAGLARGMPRVVVDAKALEKKTRPPPHLTDATLLTAMETAGKQLAKEDDDGLGVTQDEMTEAMRERGLGTPATRASILETLLKREYIVREQKTLRATDKGIALVEIVHPHVKSPAMTGEWEAKLLRLERGEQDLASFMAEIEAYVRDVVGSVRSSAPTTTPAFRRDGGPPPPPEARPEPERPRASTVRSAPTRSQTALDFAHKAPERSRDIPEDLPAFSVAMPDRWPHPGDTDRRELPPEGAFDDDDSWRDRVLAPPPPKVASKTARPSDLRALLSTVFGFESFRPYQEDVCRTAAAGRDVLLVMPTGAGKSLCYQLPGLARGGTTLVVSPLIALMEDQVAHLQRLGLAAERIHSGRSRVDSRAVCRAYLDGSLDFLFIAPERLRVRGFPELLARRKPTLIAIDEAHCISQWGHDFRPDYRMLGARLPLLRPAPILALTATATPRVQDDIIAELRQHEPMRSIHGFRRTNIAIEVVAKNPSERLPIVSRLLSDPARRPAIVYAPTRSEAERLALELTPKRSSRAASEIRAAAYHAGMDAGSRDSVQAAFLRGDLDVIIATTAFGMGIDKPNVRTVIHTALPASVEGYYQEIGRAGRDGKASRAILLWSFADLRTHEFFLERDYPPIETLVQVDRAITKRGDPPDATTTIGAIGRRAKVPAEQLEKALEKLWIHGAAIVAGDSVRRAPNPPDWQRAYEQQIAHKRDQLARIRRYAETPSCRMLELVAHFGDEHDSALSCGICDICASSLSVAQDFRPASPAEVVSAKRVLDLLHAGDGRTVGQIHRELFEAESEVDRRALGVLLGALARAGAVRLVSDAFTNDAGETITFQRVWLRRGEGASRELPTLRVPVDPGAESGRGVRGKKKRAQKGRKKPARAKPKTSRTTREAPQNVDASLERSLRAWRTAEARRRGIPAFRVLTDQSLLGIASAKPTSEAALLAIAGIGMTHVKNFGRAIIAMIEARG